MHPPHGPHRISQNGQVVLPKDVLGPADLQAGDFVYFLANDNPSGTILVIPYELAAKWFEAGRSKETRAVEEHED